MRSLLVGAILSLASCSAPARETAAGREPLLVFAAASLVRPMRVALDSFAPGGYQLIAGGSIDLARRVTDLQELPDLVAFADEEVLRRFLMPASATWYARFATSRLVIAFVDGSNVPAVAGDTGWISLLTRPGVEVARADPVRAPVGYRTLLAWQLASRRLGRPDLVRRLSATAPMRNVRGSEAELLALVQSGTADYAWAYESSARAAGLGTLRLPEWMDFSAAAESSWYATASLTVPGTTFGDTVVIRGAPITYVLTVPRSAPHPASAERLASFLLSERGRRILMANGLDAREPIIVGTRAPQ